MIWIALAVIVAAGVLLVYRFGIPLQWPLDQNTISTKGDYETDGFRPDWDEYREKPPPTDDPGWDS